MWNSTAWSGEIASLIPDVSDFLQLLISIPILKREDYIYPEEYKGDKGEYLSIEELITTKFYGVRQYSFPEYDKMGKPTSTFVDHTISYGGSYSFKENSIIVSKIDDRNLCVRMDADSILSRYTLPKDRLFFANTMRSLLSEDKCYFEMQYELIDCNLNIKFKEREFHMSLSDPQLSRNIMEYVILPLIIENREAIKEYIRQDTELSQHAETLCSAVDRLEEIYADTTELTLGYRLIENQWHCPDLTR